MTVSRSVGSDPGATGRVFVGVLGGGVTFQRDGRALVIPNRKARAILVYLAMANGMSTSREKLAALLWDGEEHQARGSLRTTLHRLRRAMSEANCDISEDFGGELRIPVDAVELDVNMMLANITAGENLEVLANQVRSVGQMLSSFADMSEGCDEWIAQQRSLIELRLRAAFAAAIADPDLSRRTRRTLAEIALRWDPLDEAACRVLMRIAAEDGEIGAAVKAYSALYESLGNDLDMEPSDETQALIAAIKTGRVASPVPSALRTALPTRPASLVVLPFHVVDAPLARFADGLLEGTIHVLSGVGDMFVIARGSALAFAGRTVDPRIAGRELGVAYALTGQVETAAGGIRVSTELSDTISGLVVRSDRYDVTADGLFALQDRLASQVVATLAPTVKDHDLILARRKVPTDQTAYDLLLQGVDLQYRLEAASYDRAGALLGEAIRRDPTYAAAHAYTATWFNFRIGQGWSNNVAADAAAAAAHATTALVLDRNNAIALAITGQTHSFNKRDYGLARQFFDRALDAGPSCVLAWTLSSATYGWLGDGQAAIAHATRALQLSPLDPFAFFARHMLSHGHYFAGEFDRAIELGLDVAASNPHLTSNLRALIVANVAAGRIPAAKTFAAEHRRVDPSFRLSSFSQRTPLSDAVRDVFIARLRVAGLPN